MTGGSHLSVREEKQIYTDSGFRGKWAAGSFLFWAEPFPFGLFIFFPFFFLLFFYFLYFFISFSYLIQTKMQIFLKST
jgi:hypothetical protein